MISIRTKTEYIYAFTSFTFLEKSDFNIVSYVVNYCPYQNFSQKRSFDLE